MKKWIAWLLVLCLSTSCITVFAESEAAKQIYSTESLEGEIIIPVTESDGSWAESSSMKNYDGGKHIWTNKSGDSITFKVENIAAGNYELYYWVCPNENNRDIMDFEVFHNGKTSIGEVYQELDAGEKVAPGWVSMGVYDFKGEGVEQVVHMNRGGNTRGTAIRLVPTDKEITAVPANTLSQAASGNAGHNIEVEPAGICTWEG